MADILIEYETRLRGRDGRRYAVRACGRERMDGLWEGWLEFIPDDGSPPLVTGRETTQPNRKDLIYWATGITDPYMDGALLRVLTAAPQPTAAVGSTVPSAPAPATPAAPAAVGPAAQPVSAAPQPVLDPFHVHASGRDVLRDQLGALSAGQLRTIIRAYGMAPDRHAELEGLRKAELSAIIMDEVARAKR